MKKNLYLLAGIALLYLAPSLVLQGIYGPSYGFLAGENRWVPDDHGGWVKVGTPDSPPPEAPSINVPIGVRYIPLFLPAALLILFLFTPLRHRLESKIPPPEEAPENRPPTP